jgi:PadR family transcriptional regulator, regulatory protein PadR
MKGTNLGEFEELVLLITAILLDEAYSVAIQRELKVRCGRKVSLSTIHVSLHRLEEKGYLRSVFGAATQERGGRRKLFFRITKLGDRALITSRELRSKLWDAIPRVLSSLQTS